MAWTNWPIGQTDNLGLEYDTLIEPWKQARARMQARSGFSPYCCNIWPRRAQDYFNSTVSAVTSTTVTVSAGAFSTDHDLVASLGGGDWLPSSFDLIIDDCDPRKIVRAQISDNVGAVLTVSDMSDYVTGKWIAALSDLVGKKCFIIRRNWPWYAGHYSLDRWPDIPNDHQLYSASSTAAGTESTGTHSGEKYIDDSLAGWKDDEWSGKYASVYAGGPLRRVSITGNTKTRLYLGTQSWTPGGVYSIHSSTARVWPDKHGAKLWSWYRGILESFEGVDPGGTVTGAAMAADQIDIDGDFYTAKDTDVWFAADDETNPDQYYCAHFWKCWRAIQIFIEGECTAWTKDKDWTGESSMPAYKQATFFYDAIPANSGTSTVAGTDPNYYFNITRPHAGASAFWAILNDDGSVYAFGEDLIDAANKIILPDIDPADIGKDVIWSYGFTRKIHRGFRRLYNQTCFIPSMNGTSVVDPPTCPTYPGQWLKRTPSTTYAEADDYGFVRDDGPSFVDGDYARYLGFNWNDANINGIETTSYSDDLEYHKGFHIARREDGDQNAIDAQLSGTATDGATTWLRCASNWFDRKWITGTVMKTHTGTVTSGTGTSLTTTGISGTCFFDSSRFVGLNVFENFVVEWDHGGNTYHARITSVSGNTINFASIGVTPQAGDTWRLKEPYEVNRYEGRTLEITTDTGTTYTTTILANDNDTLFFNAIASPVVAGWSFKIIDQPVGSMFHRVSGAWVATNTHTEPTHVTRYGKARKRDIITHDFLNEIRDCFLKMTAVQASANSWTADPDAGGPSSSDLNQWVPGTHFTDSLFLDTWADAKSQADTNWTATAGEPALVTAAHGATLNGFAPAAISQGAWSWDDDLTADKFTAGNNRNYAYAQTSWSATCVERSIDWYGYAGINSDNDDAAASGDHIREFNDNGDPVLYRKWKKWGSTAASYATTFVSPALGNTTPSTKPSQCSAPESDDHLVATDSYRGYQVLDAKALIRFNF